jgi:hypothetical protein
VAPHCSISPQAGSVASYMNTRPPCRCLLQVSQSDFAAALSEVQPAFGANTENLSKAMTHGVIDYGDAYRHLANTLRTLVSQVGASWRHALAHMPRGSTFILLTDVLFATVGRVLTCLGLLRGLCSAISYITVPRC